ncbi:TetR/AcrR family transcriptional regulator [Ruegeria arenilitoris]|uniref:TetR/AcrR family transcriptional regulator n=1 Tax=Ruegeria arenilitoris TaxID=1173585 RepID=UPI001479D5A7
MAAARVEFQRAGYESASTRKIASDAGCNVALINRYFGSKIGLFETVMEACIDLSPLVGLSQDQMVAALVDIALAKAGSQGDFDPVVVAIKSSGSAAAQDVVRDKLGNPMVEELSSLIGGEDAKQKAGVVLSIISGMFVGRVSIGADALADDESEIIQPMLTDALKVVLATGRD